MIYFFIMVTIYLPFVTLFHVRNCIFRSNFIFLGVTLCIYLYMVNFIFLDRLFYGKLSILFFVGNVFWGLVCIVSLLWLLEKRHSTLVNVLLLFLLLSFFSFLFCSFFFMILYSIHNYFILSYFLFMFAQLHFFPLILCDSFHRHVFSHSFLYLLQWVLSWCPYCCCHHCCFSLIFLFNFPLLLFHTF